MVLPVYSKSISYSWPNLLLIKEWKTLNLSITWLKHEKGHFSKECNSHSYLEVLFL